MREEVDHDDIVLLPVAVASTDPLFDSLGIPWQVVVYNERTELEVYAFGGGLGPQKYFATFAEVLDECRSDVDGS